MIDRRLLVLQVLAQYGTVTSTATALNYTPSAVSAQLRALAEELGVTLLEPDGRRVKLTPAAHLLVQRAADLNQLWEEIRAELAVRAQTGPTLLRLCGFSTPTAAILPALVTRLRTRRPELEVRIEEADPAHCFELLLSDSCDLAVVVATGEVPPIDDPRFCQRTLLADPLEVLIHRDHPLAAAPELDLSDLAGQAWITDPEGTAYHRLFLTACLSAGFRPNIAHHAFEWETAAALVSIGLGIALIPRLANLPDRYPVRRVRLAGATAPRRQIIVATRAGSGDHPLLTEALSTLGELAEEIARALE
ncbi:MAG: LysR substrate-binding domain-containing protein [Actinomycetales bacterium]